jgi:hypothetical protein
MQARQPRQVSMSGTPGTYRPSLQAVSHNDGIFTTILLTKMQIKKRPCGGVSIVVSCCGFRPLR